MTNVPLPSREFTNLRPPKEFIDQAVSKRWPGKRFEELAPLFRSTVMSEARDAYAQKHHPDLWKVEAARREQLKAENAAARSRREAEAQRRQRRPERLEYFYHGTVVPRGQSVDWDEILPAKQHGGSIWHTNMHDGSYAYATRELDDARHYAALAQDWHPDPDSTEQVVLKVTPLGGYEPDPRVDEHGRSRNTFAGDIRSKRGFRVVGEAWRESWDH